jgi:Rieske 2Fe-2S family protein
MYDGGRIARWLRERKAGHSLPQSLYLEPDAFEFDLQAIFNRNWHMAGFECELPRAGDHVASVVGRTPIVVVRKRNGDVAAFHNSCRHRGAQVCKTGAGHAARLVCPYHQWSYDLDGRLLAARGMEAGFDLAGHSLSSLRVETAGGCIYVAMSDDAPDFAPFRAVLDPALRPYGLRDAKVAFVQELIEEANWKLVMENGRECHHCAACHPELGKVLPINIGESVFLEEAASSDFMSHLRSLGIDTGEHLGDWWQVGRYPFRDGALSYSADGTPLVRQALSDTNGRNLGTLRWAVEPNNFCHVTSDLAFAFTANPAGPLRTVVTAKWLVHKDAVENVDYRLDRLTELWSQTNVQDRDLAENNQRGVSGAGYVPGPYSRTSEPYVLRLVDWYCRQAESFLGSSGEASKKIGPRVA